MSGKMENWIGRFLAPVSNQKLCSVGLGMLEEVLQLPPFVEWPSLWSIYFASFVGKLKPLCCNVDPNAFV